MLRRALCSPRSSLRVAAAPAAADTVNGRADVSS